MVSVSHKRWQIAQSAEKQTFNRRTNKKPLFENEFFSSNFLMVSDFFLDKDVLEVVAASLAAIHSIDKSRFKL
jgi:hypothetical protein